jgi:hypothetical protein
MPRVEITPSSHAAAGAVDLIALTGLTAQRVVTAVRGDGGDLKVIVWDIAGNGSISRRGDASASGVSKIAITDWPAGPGVVTAVRTDSGLLKVIAWKVAADGSIHRKGDVEAPDAGIAQDFSLSSPAGFSGVVSALVTQSGGLAFIAWQLSANGVFTRAETGTGGSCTIVKCAALAAAAGLARVAVAMRTASGNLKLIIWGIGGVGDVTRLGEIGAGPVSDVAVTARSTPNADVITASRGADGMLDVIGWSLGDDSALKRVSEAVGSAVGDLAVTTRKPDIHTYVVAALRGQDGTLKLIVWRNGADLVRHGEIVGEQTQSIEISGWAGGVVTASRGSDSKLRLDTWALRPSGMRLLHATWPPAAAATPNASPEAASRTDVAALPQLLSSTARRYGEAPPTTVAANGPDKDFGGG